MLATQQNTSTNFTIVLFDEKQGDLASDANSFRESLSQEGFSLRVPKLVLLKDETRKQKKDRKRPKSNNFDCVLSKPVKKDDLIRMLESYKFDLIAQTEI